MGDAENTSGYITQKLPWMGVFKLSTIELSSSELGWLKTQNKNTINTINKYFYVTIKKIFIIKDALYVSKNFNWY